MPTREDALMDAAGLGPPSSVEPPAHLDPSAWRLSRLRPANHPVLRLRGLVGIVNRSGEHLADTALAAVLKGKPAELRKFLSVPAAGHAFIGSGRADELAVSVVLPFIAALEPHRQEAFDLYRRYPSPPATRWTRLMQRLLEQAGHEVTVRRAIQHQGLHHQYHRYCRKERATSCPLCS